MTTTNTTIALSPEELDKLEARASAASPGPWAYGDVYADNGSWSCFRIVDNDGREIVGEEVGPSNRDAAWIAAANPATILALIAQARAALPTVEAVADEEWEDCHHCCSTGVQDGEECRHCHGRGVNRIEFDEEAVQIPAAPEVDARLVLLLAAASGYEARHEYGRITPDQWGDILRVCEGKLSSAAQQQQAGAAAPSLVRECEYPHETDKCLGCGWRAATSQDQGASPAQASAAQTLADRVVAWSADKAGADAEQARAAVLEEAASAIESQSCSRDDHAHILRCAKLVRALAASPTVPAQPVAAAADAGGLMAEIAALKPSTPPVYAPVQGAAYRHGYRDAVGQATKLATERALATSAAAQPVAKVGESADAEVAPNDAMEQLMIKHRIAVTPEYEGGFHAQIYENREEPIANGYGVTPREAIDAAMQSTTTGATDGAVGGEHVE